MAKASFYKYLINIQTKWGGRKALYSPSAETDIKSLSDLLMILEELSG